MAERRKPDVTRDAAAQQAIRDQEVLRANKELAAYFKGRRTEREARAALKTIKAFVRDRERRDAGSRPPMPGVSRGTVAKPPKAVPNRKATGTGDERPRRTRRPSPRDKTPRSQTASIASREIPAAPQPSESDERTHG